MPLGSGEILVIVVLVLVLFGPDRLPELARSFGRGMREIRKITGEFQNQLSSLADDEPSKPSRDVPKAQTSRREAPVREAPVREAPVRETPVRETPEFKGDA